MPPVLNEKSRLLKAFVASALLFSASVHASEAAADRNFIKATLSDALELGMAPARWRSRDWGLAGMAGLGLLTLTQSDTLLYPRLRGRQDWLDASMPIATEFGEGLYAMGGVAVLWGTGGLIGARGLASHSATALEALAFCGLLSPALKYAFHANRPSDRDDRHEFFTGGIGGSPSFPSGHSMTAFALAEVYGRPYGRYWTYPLAAFIGYSRIYLGAHWPSDVAAGALVGALLGNFAARAAEDKGSPRSWKFSMFPGDAGGAVFMARKQY